MDETQERIGESTRALAAAFKEDQKALAGVLGISQAAVSKKLRGGSRWSVADIEAIATHYNVTVAQLLAGPRAWLSKGQDTLTYPYDPVLVAA